MDPNEKTIVSEIDLDEILNPGASSVMIPDEKKPSVFKRNAEDLTFLDKAEEEEEVELSEEEKQAKIKSGELNSDGTKKEVAPTKTELDDILNQNEEKLEEEDPKKGRPKVQKDALLQLTNKLIEKKVLIPFEDEKPLEEYSVQDFEELIEANFEERETKLHSEIAEKFFDSLPDEMKYAAKYIADGGTDLKGLFKTLAASEEIKHLNPLEEGDDETIVRTYLQATKFGDDDEIQEEIDAWKDRNELQAKAKKFKPKLDALQEEIVADMTVRQESLKKKQEAQAQAYMQNVYKVLEPGELNGIKLERKTQGLLYAGLTQPNYPSISGKRTNLLGHLLEKHQFVEPNHALIAEALWLLADPDGYRTKVREIEHKNSVEKTVRQLKTEEGRRIVTTKDEEENIKSPAKRGIQRKDNNNFFKRT